ncbi:MAG TPA: SRPBCC domain-containing protein [Puia sp.]|nr:SRPBCC domain-containing protein [Puia sp.]
MMPQEHFLRDFGIDSGQNGQMMKNKVDDSISLEITFHAPIQNVWKAWTDPALILKWIGSDPKGKGLRAQMDVQPGGTFEISFRGSDRVEHTCFGMYTEVKEFRKLIFSWEWKSEPGVESLVIIELSPDGNDTFMQFEHTGVGNHSMHNYLDGWTRTFEKLKQLLNRKQSDL